MRLLLITYSFPPAAGVGVLRAFSLAKYLPQNGVDVDVLTTRNAASVGRDDSLLQTLPGSVRVHRTWTPDLPFALRKAMKRLISRGNATASSTSPGTALPAGFIGKIRRALADLMLPDPQVGWQMFAFPAARRLIRHRRVDAVLITVPPFSCAMLVSRLRKAFPGLPIVLDFRDEWLETTINLVSFSNSSKALRVAQTVEAASVHHATAVVCASRAATELLARRYTQEPASKFRHIPNGFDGELPPQHPLLAEDAATTNPVTLTYLGTVYRSTDPTTLVDAVLQLPLEVRQRLRLRFVGHIETESLRNALLRLGDLVEFIGFRPQAEALAYLQATTYVLLITHDPVNVSAKIYDYLAAGKPILGAVHPHGEVNSIVAETKTGWTADSRDVSALRQLLQEAVERVPLLHLEFVPDRTRIARFQRKETAAEFARMLQELVSHAAKDSR